MSKEFRRDAFSASDRGAFRTALNRCYYAVFAAIAAAAGQSGWTFKAGREGPSHAAVYGGEIIAGGFSGDLSPSEQGRLISFCSLLYRLRCIADYSPSIGVDEHDVRLAVGRMNEALEIVGAVA